MRILASALIMLAACAAPARADADEINYRPRVAQCVAQAVDHAALRACQGLTSQPCLDEDDVTTHGMVMCLSQEGEAWGVVLDSAMARLRAEQGETREAFDATQSAWEAYREAECSYRVARFGLGSGGRVELAGCYAQLIADRAIAVTLYSRTRD